MCFEGTSVIICLQSRYIFLNDTSHFVNIVGHFLNVIGHFRNVVINRMVYYMVSTKFCRLSPLAATTESAFLLHVVPNPSEAPLLWLFSESVLWNFSTHLLMKPSSQNINHTIPLMCWSSVAYETIAGKWGHLLIF